MTSNLNKLNEPSVESRLTATLTDVFQEALPNDPINQLIPTSSLSSGDIFILQALRNYMYQIFSSVYSLSSINQALISHPVFSETLIELFHAKFTPNLRRQHDCRPSFHIPKIFKIHKNVKQIIDDQILRRLCSIVTACVRTNVHIKELGEPLSFKFNCQIFLQCLHQCHIEKHSYLITC